MKRFFDYDMDTKKATCRIWHKGIQVQASAKPHKDDVSFANQFTGCQIAEMKAGVKFYNKRATIRQDEIKRLKAQLAVLEDCVRDDLATATEISLYLTDFVDMKDTQYKQLKAMRDNPHQRMSFENLGDLAENATPEQLEALQGFLGTAK